MPYDRKRFFDAVRSTLFGGKLAGLQVAGMDAVLDAVPAAFPIEHLAYCFATAKWETAHTMQPIEEYGKGAGRSYGAVDPLTGQRYYGRGFVQLTWKANYQKAKDKLGADFVRNPGLALDPALAAKIMFRGMQEGWFTGKKLSDYFGPGKSDPVNARRIINGTDKAVEIAALYRKFYAALLAAKSETAAAIIPVEPSLPPMPDPARLPVDEPPLVVLRPPATIVEPKPQDGFWASFFRAFGAKA